MAILSELYVSSIERACEYDSTDGEGFERAAFRGLTCEEFENLWEVLSQSASSPSGTFECVMEEKGGERLIHKFPDAFVSALAALDDSEAMEAASAWVKAGELGYLESQRSDVIPIIIAARDLARISLETGEEMFMWTCV